MTRYVPCKLTPTELAMVDELVARGYYKSRSHAIRQALWGVFELHKMKLDTVTAIKLERLAAPMRRGKQAMASGQIGVKIVTPKG